MYSGRIRKIHFIGIGGIGMSGLAEVMLNLGYNISGSDVKRSSTTKRLKELGIEIAIGHGKKNVDEKDLVVYSSAVGSDNAEMISARERQIPVIPRAEMLAELMRVKYSIAVAGTHGKTTTTSMIAAILGYCGFDPTVVIGGKVNSIGSNAKLGKGEYMIAEADESDGSFTKLVSTIAVVTNIDREHMDYYRDMKEVRSAYLNFINKVPFYGCAVLCLDNSNIQALIPSISRRHMTYGLTAQSDVSARDLVYRGMNASYMLCYKHKEIGRVEIKVPGKYNIYNSLAALAVAIELGIDFDQMIEGLGTFSGVQRRFQIKGLRDDIIVADDYAHHPEEIKATLKAAKEGWGRRIIAIFQPHRFSRTKDLFNNFLSAFNDADNLILTDIYPAGEHNMNGVSAAQLFDGIKACGHKDVIYIPDKENIKEYISTLLSPGDMVITLGAGDIYTVADEISGASEGGKR